MVHTYKTINRKNMDKEEFLKFFEENRDRFIPGIHNYCDRWCERCPFTSKCAVYAMEERAMDDSEVDNDLENEKFWEKLSDMMKLTMELVMDMAKEQGIDPDEVDKETFLAEEEKLKNESDEHFLSKISYSYSEKSRQWFEDKKEVVKQKEREILKKEELEISPDKTEEEFLEIKDFMEVIQWYTFQIHVKIKRALMHGDLDPAFEDPIQNDINGSAKVALIGTKRSIVAWSGMLNHFDEQEDEILELLVILEKIRKGILTEFPDVNRFKRPGFDT